MATKTEQHRQELSVCLFPKDWWTCLHYHRV